MINLSLSFREIADSTWVIQDTEKGFDQLFVTLEGPIIVLRINVMPVPKQRKAELFEELLRLNATDLLHGAYALDGDKVILIDSLEYETLDFGEFQASIDAMSLAIAQHYRILSKYRE